MSAVATVRQTLAQFHQTHLLDHLDRLTDLEREALLLEIESIDWTEIQSLVSGQEKAIDWAELAANAEPPKAIRLADAPRLNEDAERIGEAAIRAGKVAMILVAGGQGTRLGFDKPKGMFPIGPVSHRTLFEMHVDSLRGAMKQFGVSIPLFIMTSPTTDAETRRYFRDNNNLGLPVELLTIFMQGSMPAVDTQTGKVLLESPGKIAMSPDGHGGIVKALRNHGILTQCAEQGIEHFYYAQVDNPMVTACDPTLVGHHIQAGSRMTTQVVQKRFATERVGNVVSIDDRTQIIEYSDLPASVAEQTNPDGSLKLWAGNIAVHVLDRSFLQECCESPDALPYHRALKSVPYVDATGTIVKPTAPNATKFERFVFDLLPRAKTALVVEGDSSEVFAPVKNADGALTDTPAAAKQAISDRAKRWLRDAGVASDTETLVEINPLLAWDAKSVKQRLQSFDKIGSIQTDTYFH